MKYGLELFFVVKIIIIFSKFKDVVEEVEEKRIVQKIKELSGIDVHKK